VPAPDAFADWLSALEARHLSSLRVPEVTRALRALSSAYVERRRTVTAGAALDSAGKRAAFALYYGPLHFLTVAYVLSARGPDDSPASILDLGCGTGVAGAAWAARYPNRPPPVLGIDRHPWAAAEARWTYRQFRLKGRARTGDVTRLPRLDRTWGVVAGWVLNELPEATREQVLATLIRAAQAGARVLVLEPIARGVAPWWDEAAARVIGAGGRADEWRFAADLPPLVRLLDHAAGLDHRELTVRSLSCHL
jgi:SAM-dependent methyltransferase